MDLVGGFRMTTFMRERASTNFNGGGVGGGLGCGGGGLGGGGRELRLRIKMSFKQVLVFWVAFMVMCGVLSESKCNFEAIFNFGDSNSDTGAFWAAFPAQPQPFGMTYFKRPAGRASDGRLLIDFLAQAIGVPFISPYLQSIGTDYRHGANFATLASTVLQPQTSLFVSGLSPFYLDVQLNQMKTFKAKVDELFSKGSTNLPPPDIFGKSIYTFNIGQNDFTSNLASMGIGGVQQYLPQVISQISNTIKELYGLGGRTFLVQNIAPIGCYPSFLVQLPHDNNDIDGSGCMISYNNAVQDYNNKLKDALAQTRAALPDASIIYVDTHSIILELFQNPTKHGLQYSTKACCGKGDGSYNYDPKATCGNSKEATPCGDPHNYVSWDGMHATEAANKQITYSILSGSFFDPPFPIHDLCDIQPIG